MNTVQFTVPCSQHGTTRKVKVFVYDSLTDMYEATDRWGKRTENESPEHNYHAITHSFNQVSYDDNGTTKDFPNVGIIRLVKGYLWSYIIAHEICHAALNIYSIDCVKPNDDVMDHIDPGNETFCHIVSELEHNIVSKLNRLGCYGD